MYYMCVGVDCDYTLTIVNNGWLFDATKKSCPPPLHPSPLSSSPPHCCPHPLPPLPPLPTALIPFLPSPLSSSPSSHHVQDEVYDESRGPSIDQLVSLEDVDSLKYMGWEQDLTVVVQDKEKVLGRL